MGKVGLSEGDGGVAIGAIGSELRATQVGVGEVGPVQLDRACSNELGFLEVAIR